MPFMFNPQKGMYTYLILRHLRVIVCMFPCLFDRLVTDPVGISVLFLVFQQKPFTKLVAKQSKSSLC